MADSSGYGPDNGIVMQVPGGTVWTGWTVFESGRNGLTWQEAMADMHMAATSSISGIPGGFFEILRFL